MKTDVMRNETVAEMVASDYRTAEVFKRHGIDFCCGGKKPVSQVCLDKHIDPLALMAEIESVKQSKVNQEQDVNSWSLSFLADYIVNVHHTYVNNNLPLLSEFADKVALVHGDHNPETKEIAGLWAQLVAELSMHMKKEELVLFPYIKNLEMHSRGELKVLPPPHFNTVKAPIHMMEQEHDVAGSLLKEIEKLSDHFNPPVHACNTYRVLYAKLQEFQNDLHRHIHLENNILFPKAIKLEETLSATPASCAL